MEEEIENYKDSISRTSLLNIGDEAVASLRTQAQIALTEIVIWQEVDRLIARRLRLPSYRTWRQRRMKQLALFGRPDYWGLDPASAFIRELQDTPDRHVLVAGASGEGPALFLAARGCEVTTLSSVAGDVDRLLAAAQQVGLRSRVRGYCTDLSGWSPDVEVHAVVCASDALGGLAADARWQAISTLQAATTRGGLHVLQGGLASASATASAPLPVEELRARYAGWRVAIEGDGPDRNGAFVARREAVA